jgi:hypothetical protein
MYDIITYHPKSNVTLTVRFASDWGCWIAFEGSTPEDSSTIGEGSNPADARADFWVGVHGYDKTARLLAPEDFGGDRWCLRDGSFVEYFDTREEAIASAEADEYIISPLFRRS